MDYAYAIKKIDKLKIWKTDKRIEVEKLKAPQDWIKEESSRIIRKYPKLYKRFKHLKNVIPLLICYDHIDALTNISLSVHPDLKQKWKRLYGLSHELFGAFYNTDKDLTFCSIFPEIETSKVECNAYDFVPEKGKTYLVNPPYTVYHIVWSIKKILKDWKESNFIVVVPVWDKASRAKLGLKTYEDLPEITELIEKVGPKNHKIINLSFYSGVDDRDIKLKDPIHLFFVMNDKTSVHKNVIKEDKPKKNKTKKNRQKGGGLFEVTYGSNKINGQLMKKEECIEPPIVKIANNGNNGSLFTLVMKDPDAPGGNYLHWLVCNIENGILDKGVVEYNGPNPPSSHSHTHHYIFELYKQSAIIDCSEYKDRNRSSFDINGMIVKHGLEKVGSVFFTVDPKA